MEPPSVHAHSLELCRQALLPLPACVETCAVVAPGLVALMVRGGAAGGYGSCGWRVVVGGTGVGEDEAIDPRFGVCRMRSSVCVRFASPLLALHRVDDCGLPDGSFWDDGLGAAPTLGAIAVRCASWLERGGADDVDAFDAAEAKTIKVLKAIETFRAQHTCPWAGGLPPGALTTEATRAVANNTWRDVTTRLMEGVYSLPLFTPAFCAKLVEDLDAWEASGLPKRRPNTMNTAGLVTNEAGMAELADDLLNTVVAPLTRALYAAEVFADTLDHHHTFCVRYAVGGDEDLAMHHDASEVTLNVCLGNAFQGARLDFCGRFGDANHRTKATTVAHAVGTGVVHLGRHRHGVGRVEAGERVNLVLWARSSAFRAAAAYGHVPPDGYPLASPGAVDRCCLSKPNDHDYAKQIARFSV